MRNIFNGFVNGNAFKKLPESCDIVFNAYSFIDFDYEERKGTDALLIKRTLPKSTVEVSGSFDNDFNETVIAAKYSHSLKANDLQYLIGKYKNDLVLGTGWAGQIGNAGFKGEVAYFQPYRSDSGKQMVIGSVSFDYTFQNTVALRFEALYTSKPAMQKNNFLFQTATAKTLSPDPLSLFGAISFNVNPLIQLYYNTIWYTDSKSWIVNPGINFSLNDNNDLLIAAQHFSASRFTSLTARLKWNF